MYGSMQEIADLILAQQEGLARKIVERTHEALRGAEEMPDTRERGRGMEDARYHLAYLAEALRMEEPSLFTHYVEWIKVLFAGLRFPEEGVLTTLGALRATLKGEFPEAVAGPAVAYIEEGMRHLQTAAATVPSFLEEASPLGGLARDYLRLLLEGDRQQAARRILDAVAGGTQVKDIYLHVFQPSQYEIGRLWQMNRISVAQEHYCTAATQLVMSQLYPHIFSTDKIGRRFVATCVGGELHEIGMRTVADFFEMDGWDTYYLGANTPQESVLSAVEDREAHVLGISATMTFHAGKVASLVTRVREALGGEVKILVGGYPFKVAPRLWKSIGADGFAVDAQGAVHEALRLVAP